MVSRMNIFLWQGKREWNHIYNFKKMFSLEKKIQYQTKCMYELGETKMLLKLLCLLKFLLYVLYRQMSHVPEHIIQQYDSALQCLLSSLVFWIDMRVYYLVLGNHHYLITETLIIILQMEYNLPRIIYYKYNIRL